MLSCLADLQAFKNKYTTSTTTTTTTPPPTNTPKPSSSSSSSSPRQLRLPRANRPRPLPPLPLQPPPSPRPSPPPPPLPPPPPPSDIYPFAPTDFTLLTPYDLTPPPLDVTPFTPTDLAPTTSTDLTPPNPTGLTSFTPTDPTLNTPTVLTPPIPNDLTPPNPSDFTPPTPTDLTPTIPTAPTWDKLRILEGSGSNETYKSLPLRVGIKMTDDQTSTLVEDRTSEDKHLQEQFAQKVERHKRKKSPRKGYKRTTWLYKDDYNTRLYIQKQKQPNLYNNLHMNEMKLKQQRRYLERLTNKLN